MESADFLFEYEITRVCISLCVHLHTLALDLDQSFQTVPQCQSLASFNKNDCPSSSSFRLYDVIQPKTFVGQSCQRVKLKKLYL
jgi:hypothetical protein